MSGKKCVFVLFHRVVSTDTKSLIKRFHLFPVQTIWWSEKWMKYKRYHELRHCQRCILRQLEPFGLFPEIPTLTNEALMLSRIQYAPVPCDRHLPLTRFIRQYNKQEFLIDCSTFLLKLLLDRFLLLPLWCFRKQCSKPTHWNTSMWFYHVSSQPLGATKTDIQTPQ